MTRPFAVFDIDGTLIRWQMYHAVANSLAKSGSLDSKAWDSIKSARMLWKQRSGEESFKSYEKLLVIEHEKLLTRLDYAEFNKAVDAVFEEYKDQVYVYTRGLIAQLKQDGYMLFAISGSQTEIVSKIAKHWDFDDYIGTNYEIEGGRFTGKVTNHLGKKHLVIEQLAQKHAVNYEGSVAVGDSEGDITMLEAAQNPIAFNPTKKLFQHAKQKGWKVVIERKNMVYELEPKGKNYILK